MVRIISDYKTDYACSLITGTEYTECIILFFIVSFRFFFSEMSNNRKLLVASVLKFLKKEIDSKKITPDQEESLNVASQCLAMAFNTSAEDAEGLPDLMDVLSKACPDSK